MSAKKRRLIMIFPIVFLLAACSLQQDGKFRLVDAKTVTAIDEKLAPVGITDSFPNGSTKVFCWMQWQDAKINTRLVTKWQYLTDDVHIVDHAFLIPKKDGVGSVELAMPQGKILPPGLYKVDIVLEKRVLKTLKFKVE